MNFLKRAIKYCVRQRLRTLLLFLTFTLLSTTVLIAVSSEEAVLQGTKQIEETVGASVRMEIRIILARLRISEMGLLDIPIMATVLQKK